MQRFPWQAWPLLMKHTISSEKFTVVPSTSRTYGYSIKAPAYVTWATGPGNTYGWYKHKRAAQHRCNILNQETMNLKDNYNVGYSEGAKRMKNFSFSLEAFEVIEDEARKILREQQGKYQHGYAQATIDVIHNRRALGV